MNDDPSMEVLAMSIFVPLEDAQTRLQELLDGIHPGEELFLTKDDFIVARLIKAPARRTEPRPLGAMKGSVLYMAPDFNAPMELVASPLDPAAPT